MALAASLVPEDVDRPDSPDGGGEEEPTPPPSPPRADDDPTPPPSPPEAEAARSRTRPDSATRSVSPEPTPSQHVSPAAQPELRSRRQERRDRTGSVVGGSGVRPGCVAPACVAGGSSSAASRHNSQEFAKPPDTANASPPSSTSIQPGVVRRRASLNDRSYNNAAASAEKEEEEEKDSKSTDKGGIDAATFINTRPWVRQRPKSTGKEDTHPDQESTHFWDPDRAPAHILDTFGAVLNYVHMMILPMICFIYQTLPTWAAFTMLIFDAWMAVDIYMNLKGMRPYYEKKNATLVTNKKQIRQHYLRASPSICFHPYHTSSSPSLLARTARSAPTIACAALFASTGCEMSSLGLRTRLSFKATSRSHG